MRSSAAVAARIRRLAQHQRYPRRHSRGNALSILHNEGRGERRRQNTRFLPAATKLMSAEIAAGNFGQSNQFSLI
jgi:hypothetical protein